MSKEDSIVRAEIIKQLKGEVLSQTDFSCLIAEVKTAMEYAFISLEIAVETALKAFHTKRSPK